MLRPALPTTACTGPRLCNGPLGSSQLTFWAVACSFSRQLQMLRGWSCKSKGVQLNTPGVGGCVITSLNHLLAMKFQMLCVGLPAASMPSARVPLFETQPPQLWQCDLPGTKPRCLTPTPCH